LIAVIGETYANVATKYQILAYLHKSDLNYECYELLAVFMTLREFQVIGFISEKELQDEELDTQLMLHSFIKDQAKTNE
jgi:hypothetical protein